MITAMPKTAIAKENPWHSFTARLERVRQEIASVATYWLRIDDQAIAKEYRFLPGQFNMLYLPGCGEVAISLSGSAESNEQQLVHTIRVVGRVTEAIARLPVGSTIGVRGPFGSSWPIDVCQGKDVVIVTGGLGMAPLRPMIYWIMNHRSDFGRVVLLYGARSPDLVLYTDELDSWRAHEIEIQQTVDRADDAWSGAVGVVPLLLDRLPGLRPDSTEVVTCGPEIMMHYAALSARKRGIPKQSIWLSMERNMQCAVGLCGHCQLGSTFVCRDGPVFRYDALEPFLRIRDF